MRVCLLLLFVVAGGVSLAQEAGSTVTGVVKLNGEPRRAKTMNIPCPHCAPLYPRGMAREDLVVDEERNIRGAFVYVKSGLEGKKFPVPETSVLVEMKGCRYEPHVLGVRAGQKIRLLNRDPHNHCVHGIPFDNREINVALTPGQDFEKSFDKPEVMIRLKDDVYPWMSAWLGVVDHPFFAVTGPDGKFAIKGLPAGKYTIEVWQPECRPATHELEVGGKEPAPMEWRLELKKD